ncbi:MAG: AAA family ATPase, partial [Cyanobacteriota bacterium]
IKGKFDQFKRDIPFSAWVQALQNLMRQLLTESTDKVQQWKAKILAALGENGQIITDVIPELELVIGKQPPVPELEGSAAQKRFNRLFGKFIRVFATKEHPLVIFLDDLQWADSASLKLMQWLMSEGNTRYLLLIGAYRDNEISGAHPLMLTLNEIRNAHHDRQQAGPIINQITLAPLDQSSLNRLIADTLSCPPQRAEPLSELVFTKTNGNPFFTNQFLKSLHEDGLITFDPPQSSLTKGGWQCDIAKVRTLVTNNDVVEFMALQLQKLPINTQTVLQLAACIGNSFDLATLSIVYEKSQAETANDLWRALQEGVIMPVSEVYKFFQDAESVGPGQASELSVSYKFLHDRVQQAAYFLIPEDQKQSTHLKIGRLLLSNTPEKKREEKIFDIVNPLNYGVELITQPIERDKLAKLNLIAGRKAKAATAYAAALRYLTVGLELLAVTHSWQNQYELTLALYGEAVETAFLNGDFEQMNSWAEVVQNHAKTLLDKVKVYEVLIQANVAQNKLKEAVNTALQVLKPLGVEFPEQPSQLDIQQGLEETASILSGRRIEDLIDLPLMTQPYQLAAMRILSTVWAAAYQVVPELMLLIVFKLVNLSLKHGNAPVSAYAYTNYGLILCGVVGDIDSGYQFGQLALSVLERLDAKELKAKIFAVVNATIQHWKQHLRSTLKPLLDAYQSGVETGDLEFASHGAYLYGFHSYFSGKPLATLEPEMAIYSEALSQLKQETNLNYHKIYRQ